MLAMQLVIVISRPLSAVLSIFHKINAENATEGAVMFVQTAQWEST